MFPILMDQDERERISNLKGILKETLLIPEELPIEFVEQFRDQIEKNHDQTIEQLGGLHPRELVAAIYGVSLEVYFGLTKKHLSDEQTVFALTMIEMRLNEFNKKEELCQRIMELKKLMRP